LPEKILMLPVTLMFRVQALACSCFTNSPDHLTETR
jgi:hypothetical protein